MPNGRPTDYTPELGEEIVKMAMLGEWAATNQQIADYCGVESRTVYRWKQKYPDFDAAIRKAKVLVDNRVESVLYHQAISGNVPALLAWLKNRRPNEWRDKHDIDLRTPDGVQMREPQPDIDKLLNLSPEHKLELARSARAHHELLKRLELVSLESMIDVEAEEDSDSSE
ncbi:MAG: hypothetical protein ACJ8BW_13710 [Ktedonobacteraceae bacterium]|jgi:transposase-like protein